MSEIDFRSATQADNQPMTDNIYDVAVGLSNATHQKQQSPLERVGNDASDSIVEALEEYTVPLFNNNPLHGAMVKTMGGCSIEIRRSVIENATQYGESDDNALYGLAVFDLFDENLQPIGAVFTNPTIEGFKDIVFGCGGLYFNRSKLNELPLLVTDDIHLAFKTTYPVYAPYSDSKIKAYALKALMQAHPDLCVIAPVHQQDDIQRRYTDLDVKIAFIPEPPNFAMSQDELDSMIQVAVEQAKAPPKGHLAKPMKWENGHFHITEAGLYFVEEDKNGISHKRFISSPVLVTAKTRDDTSNNWGVLLQWKDDNGAKHIQALSMELFQTDGAELRKALAYQGVTIAPDQRARNLFQCYLMSYQANRFALCVDRVGWHGEVFVLPHERIGQSSNGDLIVYQANHGLDNRYQSKGTLEQWRNDVAQLVQKHSRLVFALCTAFSGQLLDPLNQQGGGFHIKGGSSRGKSTALNLACSVWGNPKHFYRTWRATGNALEHTAYMHNDSFLVLDEIGEIANPKELGNIVYMLSNGLGKGRMTKQITAKPVHQWKVTFLSSGEKSLKEIMQEQGQKTKLGQEIRLADIDIDESEYGIFDCLDFAEDGAKQSIELASRLNQSYGVAGIAWLNYLTSNKAERIGEARELLEQYRQVLTMNQSQGHIVRVANYFALVATAGEMAASAGITGWEAGTAFNAVQMVFNQWLGGFDQIGNFEDREILAQVKAFFEANGSSRFECITPDPIHPEKINNRAGYWKIEGSEKVYLVFSEQFKKEICKGFDYRKVAKVLKANQWINCNAKEYQKSERIPDFDKPMRMYVFNGAMWSWHENENSHNSIRNIRNTRNSLDIQGFQPLRNTKIEYVTHVTKDVTANPMPDPVTYSEPVTYCENQTRNTANPSNDGLVTAVTAVTSKNNGVRDLLGEPVHPEPAKQEQPAPKKQAKAKPPQPEPVPANDDTLDLFGGML